MIHFNISYLRYKVLGFRLKKMMCRKWRQQFTRLHIEYFPSCQSIESKWCHHIHANFFVDKQTCNLHPMSGNTSSWGIGGKREILASQSVCRAAINRFYSLRPTSETSVSSRMRSTKISRYLVEASKEGKVISSNIDNSREICKFSVIFISIKEIVSLSLLERKDFLRKKKMT